MDKPLTTRRDILAAVQAGRISAEQGYVLIRDARNSPTPASDPPKESVVVSPDPLAPIAVIGLAGRFPGAGDADAFWSLLEQGVDCVTEVPSGRWPLAGFYDPRPGIAGRSVCKWGGFLDDISGFDPHFFQLSAREAELMDPQQRLFLMEAWHALEDAGYAGPVLDARSVGVFAGCAEGDYYDLVRESGRLFTPHGFTGAASAILAARIAYHLNLRGPALAIDTACSSSLVALHLACESLRRGECEMALAGGVHVMATPRLHLLASSAGMLSSTGRCHAFGAGADGFVPAEAVGVVLLKPLARALADGDSIRAVIEGSAINQDGRTNGITAPSAPSQAALALGLYERFGIDPATIGYVETHGTGTALGDPIEIDGLTAAFRCHTAARGFCRIGSVKSAVGHAQLAAGITGFIKLVLALERGVIPPTLHASTANPGLNLEDSPFRIAEERETWPCASDGRRRGAISAFGFSGTNAHLVARAHDGTCRAPGQRAQMFLILLSGNDAAGLVKRAHDLLDWLGERPQIPLADIAFTLVCGGAHLPWRRALVVEDLPALRRQLLRFTASVAPVRASDPTGLNQQVDAVLALMPVRVADAGASYGEGLAWLARSYEAGAEVDAGWERLFLDQAPCRVALPATRFRRERYWVGPSAPHSLVITPTDSLPEQHRVGGHAVLPGAALISAALGVAADEELYDLRLMAALPRRSGESLEIQVQRDGDVLGARTSAGTVLMQARCHPAGIPPPVPPWSGAAPSTTTALGLYERLAESGLVYGPDLRGLRALIRDGNLVRAEVEATARCERFGAVAAEALDAAFQAAAALADPAVPLPLMVLDRIDRLLLLGPLPPRFVLTLQGQQDDAGGWQADVWLSALDGSLLAFVGGLRFAPVSLRPALDATDVGAVAELKHVSEPEPGDRLLAWVPVWRSASTRTALAGTELRVLDRAMAQDGHEWLADALSRNLLPAIAQARRIAADAAAGIEVPPLLQRYRIGDPAGEALAGFWRSAVREYPALRIVCMGADDAIADELLRRAAAGVMPARGMVEARCNEAGLVELLQLEERVLPDTARALPTGTVVISGGTGRLGRVLGAALAAGGAQVVLLGRSARPVVELGRAAGQVFELTADVADEASLQRALARVREVAGPITGVVHAAGELFDCLLGHLHPSTALAATRAKIAGVVLLDRLTSQDPLTWFVAYGALASRTGNTGQALYGYANRYLAAFARQRSSRATGITLAIEWPLWTDGGMRPGAELLDALQRGVGLTPMPSSTGLHALACALELAAPELVLAHGDPRKLNAAITGVVARAGVASPAMADLRPRLVGAMLAAVSANLGVREAAVEEDAPLADYGFDSISLTALADELNRTLGSSFSPATFFEVKSIGALADLALLRWPEAISAAIGLTASAVHTIFPASLRAAPTSRHSSAQETGPDAPESKTRDPAAATVSGSAHADPLPVADEPIAVIGIDLRFPGADDSAHFWSNLCSGYDPIREIPPDRWNWRDVHGDPTLDNGCTNVRWGGFIEHIDRFDAAFFGIAPIEADAMDPQQRLLLESAWRAIEHAGHGPRSLAGSRTAVYVGCAGYDYATLQRSSGIAIEGYTATGIAPSLMSNRLSYLLDLVGPSETVDTACSSSLVALDRAVRAIRAGSCEAALVAAASAILTPELHIAFARAGMLNPDGQCRAFDAGARGYVRSEGVATVYLKPLSRARADGDTVHAVILGSAVNHGGRATSLTAPSAAAQAEVLRSAWRSAGVAAGQIGYIEAHGTGTALGDPVEVRGLCMAFDGAAGPTPCLVGTVKSHIGHLEATAGLAGFIGATLAVREAVVPGLLHFAAPNPLIDLGTAPLAFAERTGPWKRGGRRIAGVSSFGFGGTNAHVVVAQAPSSGDSSSASSSRSPQLIVLSARTSADLGLRIADLRAWLQTASTCDGAATSPERVRAMVAGLLAVQPEDVPLDEPLADLGLPAVGMRLLAQQIEAEGLGRVVEGLIGLDATVRSIVTALGLPRGSAAEAPALADIAFTLLHGRDRMVERLAFAASTLGELSETLAALEEQRAAPRPVHRTQVDGTGATLLDALRGGAAQPLIRELVTSGQIDALAELWVSGVDLPLTAMFPHPQRRLPLPPYRFQGVRHWFGVHGGMASVGHEDAATLSYFGAHWQPIDSVEATLDSAVRVIACAANAPLAARLEEVTAALASALLDAPLVEAVVVVTAGNLPQLAVTEAVAALLASWHAEEPRLRAVALAAPAAGAASGQLARRCLPGTALRRVDAGFEQRLLQPLQPDAAGVAWTRGRRVLITGGAGGVGRLIARHLAGTYGARLLLVGRRRADAGVTELLAECARLGGQATYLCADVSSADGALAALDAAVDRLGTLDDIVHAAGVLADRLQATSDRAAVDAVLDPKVEGLLALERAANTRQLQPRFVLLSSLAGWLGNPGQATYAAANRFMDAYAEARAAVGESWLSIAWPLWEEGGMRPGVAELQRLGTETGLALLPTRAALAAQDTLLGTPVAFAAVAWGPPAAAAINRLVRNPRSVQPKPLPVTSNGAGQVTALLAEALGSQIPLPLAATLDEAGFSSLTAVRLRHLLLAQLALDWPVAKLVGFGSVGELIGAIEAASTVAAASRQASSQVSQLPPDADARNDAASGENDDGPLSQGQRLLWLQHKLDPGGFAYHLPVLLELTGGIDTDALQRALDALVARHGVLRTRYEERAGEPWRRVDVAASVTLRRLTAPPCEPARQREWLRTEARRPFDLASRAPVDFALVNGMAGHQWLLCRFHHIAVDGLSLRRLFDEFDQLLAGQVLALPPPPYGLFVAAEERYLGSPQAGVDRAFWRQHLAIPPSPLDLPGALRPRTQPSKSSGEVRTARLDATGRRGLSARVGAGTLFHVALSAWAAVLARFVDDGRVRLLVPTASQHGAPVEDCVGYCVNPLLIELEVSRDANFDACRERVRLASNAAMEHGRWPLAKVLADLAGPGERQPALTDVAHAGFYFQSWMGDAEGGTGGRRHRRLELLHHEGEFPLVMELIDRSDRLDLILKHDPGVVEPAVAELLLERYRQLLADLADGDVQLEALWWADRAERAQIQGWSHQGSGHRPVHGVSTRLRHHARLAPDRDAVLCGDETWSLGRVDRHADALALALRGAGAGPGSIVAVLLQRCVELPSALLGVMRSGGAYLPLDPAFPVERRNSMLADSGASHVLLRRADALPVPPGVLPLYVEDCVPQLAAAPHATSPLEPCDSDLAYVIYTSGSTGTPKGVEISHASLAQFLEAMACAPGFSAEDRLLALTTVAFDISGLELLLPLASGGSVVILDAAQARDATRLRQQLEAPGITVAQATPATWRMLHAAGWRGGGTLRRVLVGGEDLPPYLAETLLSAVPEVWNMYGPTETTIWSTTGRVMGGERITVGRPIAGTTCIVVDADEHECAIGVAGELWIGGAGVARGYHGRPTQTAERFVRLRDQTFYRSGDRARWLVDGRLQVLGRLDRQLKVNGFRVEPAEIEAAVVRRFGDRACVVVCRPSTGGLAELTAFVLPDSKAPVVLPAERAARLRAWLPDHLVPVQWLALAALPTTPNGKLDLRALCEAPLRELQLLPWQHAPMSRTTGPACLPELRGLLATLLQCSPQSLDANLPLTMHGVDSLRAVALADAASAHFQIDVRPTDLFSHPSLVELALHIGTLRGQDADPPHARREAQSDAVVASVPAASGDIAVIGMAGRFPDAPDLDTFWANLLAGRVSTREIPPERWNWRTDQGDNPHRWAAFVDDIGGFDPGFFGMTPQEATCSDPQQRLFLMEAWNALADTGRQPQAYAGSRCGVYVGATMGDYARLLEAAGELNAFSMLGGGPALIPARIAYHLNLKGPAVAVDTACSASLVAVHQACQAIAAGEVDLALAGGVFLMCTPFGQSLSAAANILSPTGRCRPFSEAADGIVIGEAVGVIVLKPLARALADGDPIRAVIKATGANQDGRSNGIAAPMAPAQGELIRDVVARAGVDPDTIGYIETHGTGTRLGDPVELEGLRLGLGRGDEGPPCYIGSVKANLGHSYQAAGIAGLIKAVLCIEHGLLPPQPGVGKPNPHLRLDQTPFLIPSRAMVWPETASPRRAGVSSFGLSGTNAHVLLEAWPDAPLDRPVVASPFALSRCWVADASKVTDTAVARVDLPPVAALSEPQAEVRRIVLAELAGLGGCAPGAVPGDALLEADLGMDSIKLLGLVSRLKRVAGARAIDPAALGTLRTVDQLLQAAGADAVSGAECNLAPNPGLAPMDEAPIPDADLGAAPAISSQLPLLNAQMLFLLGHHLIQSSSLCSWLRLDGPLDPARLHRAWQALVNANPGLRVVLRTSAPDGPLGDYRAALIGSATVAAVPITDLASLAPAAQDAALQDAFCAGLNREWKLDRWPLHDLHLFRLGATRHALFLSNEHLISDGIGNQLILRRLLEHYACEAGAGPPPPLLSDDEYVRQLAALDAYRPAPLLAGATTGNAPYAWNPGDREIEEFVPRFTADVHEYTRDRTRQLRDAAGTFGVSLNALLLTALLRAAARTAAAQPVVQMPTGGRAVPGVDASDFIGCFARNLSVSLRPEDLLAPWHEAAAHCHAQIQQRLVDEEDWHQTLAMAAVLRHDVLLCNGVTDPGLRPLFRSRLASNLYAPFIGETGIASRYGDLHVSGYRAGTVNGPATIDVLHEIFDDRLHGSWNYDAGFFRSAEIACLRQAFEHELAQAIDLAQATGTGGSEHDAPAVTSAGMLPTLLLDALEVVCGRRPTASEATQPLDSAFGMDSLRRIRVLARLPAPLRNDPVRRARMLGARTLVEMAAVLDGMQDQASELEPPIAGILRQMSRREDAPAVVGPDGRLSYGELDALTAQLASALRGWGIGAGDRVGVLLARGCLLPAAIVAVMRAGAAYVPLDPDLPSARLSYIAGHASLSALVSANHHATLINALQNDRAGAPLPVLLMDQAAVPNLQRPGTSAVTSRAAPAVEMPVPALDDPMAVLYTSGSTGRPKGVVLNNRGYANRLEWHQRQFALQAGESVLQKTTTCFDVSIWELFWPLMNGGTVHVIDAATARDPWALASIMRERRIAVVHFVPSMFGEFVGALGGGDTSAFPDLRWVVLSGEALPVPEVRAWFRNFGVRTQLANLYGPTEASIDVTCHVMDAPPETGALRIPIGTAIDGVQLYVLDADLRPLPDGQAGELCIGGVQLATGYHEAAELTARAFVPFRASDLVGDRIYRTGDLVSRGPDGVLDYLGRLDSQIKLRGFRIEPGEIEAVLRELRGVREAAVTVEGELADRRLIAWIACTGELRIDEILEHCAGRLPPYMVPERIELCAQLPRTPSGKLDRRTLQPSPQQRVAPLAPAQRWLVQHFPAPHAWWGYTRFRCQRTLQPAALLAAYRHLVRRHEALRTTFSRDAAGAWQQCVLEASIADRAELRVIDAGGLDPAALDALAASKLRAACERFDLARWPLDAAFALRRSSADWEFCLANHHINGDFISGDVLFRQFWDAYEAALAGAELPLQPGAPSPADVADHLARLDADGALESCRMYWRDTTLACRDFEFRPDDPDAANAEAASQTIEFQLSEATTRRLLDNAREALEIALYPLLAAPLYVALGEASGHCVPVVSHRMAGRSPGGIDLAESVGNFAVHFPLPVVLAGRSLQALARDLAAVLAAVPRDGLGYDWLGATLGEECYPDDRLTPLRLNYLGRLPGTAHGSFQFATHHHNQRLAPREATRSAEIELHLGVRDGRLQAQLSFAVPRWSSARMQALLDRYYTLLQELAATLHPPPDSGMPDDTR
jgi:amino acid adenylation domain-containing protein